MENKNVLIEAKNLVKTYGEGEGLTYALNDVSIKIYEHDFLVIIGGSGCGKSTFLNMIGAIDTVDSGSIIVNGRDITSLKDKDLTFMSLIINEFYC
ncbi:MAG: ATP-binding cassette domain-containing protein [bacterium]|nr:ATP-binding cassette domain-containing protein [bacterium]